MKRVFAGVAVGLMTASSVQAAPFRLQDIDLEQHCECDCFMGLYRPNARPDAHGVMPLLVSITGRAEIRIDSQPMRLTATENFTPSKGRIYDNTQAGVRLELHLRETGRERETGYLKLAGDIRVTYHGASVTVPVEGKDWCDADEDL